MPVGWAKADRDTADVLRDVKDGDIISVNFLSLDLQVTDARVHDLMSSGGLVTVVDGKTSRGGAHRLMLWEDAAVKSGDTGELLDWDYAIKNQRLRKREGEWQNNSDPFTSVEFVESAQEYELELIAHTTVTLQADNPEEAWKKAKDSVSPGMGWTVLDDKQAADLYVEEVDDGYEVTMTAVASETVYTTGDPEDIQYSKRPNREFVGVEIQRILDADGYEV